jgi:phenylalanyl-tRNA synthetase beta chain
VFLRQPNAPDGALDVAGVRQPMRVAAAAFGPAAEEQWGIARREVDFFDVKGDLEALLAPSRARFEPAAHPAMHPGRCARILLGNACVGWLGELHPRWQQKYELPGSLVVFELDAAPLQVVGLPAYREVSKFPAVSRDIAVILPESVPVQPVLDDLAAHKPMHVESITLFDLYRGSGVENGKKSLAFRVLLQDTQKTLTDQEVDSAVLHLVQRLRERFGGKLRD